MKSKPYSSLRIAGLALALACGDSTPSDPPTAQLTGAYSVVAQFDKNPVAAIGTVVFQQPGGRTVLVSGSLQLSGVVYNHFSDGSLVGSTLKFTVGNGWRFEGTVAGGGRSISGRHVFAVVPDTVAGHWTATASNLPPPPISLISR